MNLPLRHFIFLAFLCFLTHRVAGQENLGVWHDYLNKSRYFLLMEQNDSAKAYAEKALAYVALADVTQLKDLGDIFMGARSFEKALFCYEEALGKWEYSGSHTRSTVYAALLKEAATTALHLQSPQKALKYSAQAFIRHRALYNLFEEPLLNCARTWADVLQTFPDVEGALSLFEFTLEVYQKHPSLFEHEASYHIFLQKLSGILRESKWFVQAMEVEKLLLRLVENYYGANSLEAAFQATGLALALENAQHLDEAVNSTLLAARKALAYYRGAFLLLSIHEKEMYLGQTTPYLNEWASFLKRNCAAYPELVKDLYPLFALMKKPTLEAARILQNDALRQEEWQVEARKYQKLRQELNGLMHDASTSLRREEVKNEMAALETRIFQDERWEMVSSLFPTLNTTRLASQLTKEEAILELVRFEYLGNGADIGFSDEVYYAAFVIDRYHAQPRVVFVPFNQRTEKAYYENYRYQIRGGTHDPLSYRRYWKPFEGLLNGITKIHTIADGIYHLINPQTLQVTDARGNMTFLGEQLDIRMLFSIRDFLPEPHQYVTFTDPLLVGNPYFDLLNPPKENRLLQQQPILLELERGDLQPLPKTEEEVIKIGAILENASLSPQMLLRGLASEANIKSHQSPKLLHIATHGYFAHAAKTLPGEMWGDESDVAVLMENPLLRSGLVLAGALNSSGEDDGLLTAFEVGQMNLKKTELVVLSACETGLGEIKNSEGVYGLQRAFRIAGAEALLMSLWKVPDHYTSQLMVAFYDYWLSQGMEKALALRAAQADIRKEQPRPYFWGGFVLIGE